ncbi:MAG: NAD(P)-binding domain-containing protein, partial [Paracoccaceae bacterium]|nr:NAD(P)-binding domain-containing protein [Paracoccaceae bacterium]
METIGFIGTGTITAAIVRGLKASNPRGRPVLLSPRNADLSAALAAQLAGVEVAASNQDVLDRTDLVVLAVRPQVAEVVLRGLRFAPDTPVISLIAGLDHDRLRDLTGATRICRAIPL